MKMSSKSIKSIKQSTKKNVIFEDKHFNGNGGATFRLISDKNKPFYEYNYKEMK